MVAHLVALVETSASNLEMSTALRIISNLLKVTASAISFITHGGEFARVVHALVGATQ